MHSKGEIMYDYVIIGSGFGGSVSALRLAEKGYKIRFFSKLVGRKMIYQNTTYWN